MIEAFLLGLSNGGVCVAYCAPVLVPYLLGQGCSTAPQFRIVLLFLLGRLAGYSVFSLFAFGFHIILRHNATNRAVTVGIVYIVLSVFLIIQGFSGKKAEPPKCAMRSEIARINVIRRLGPYMAPVFMGLLTGLALCPPFLLAFTAASNTGSLAGSLVFFLSFFCGTSVFFLPFPLLGIFQRLRTLTVIGRLSMGIAGVWYFYSGLVLIMSVIK